MTILRVLLLLILLGVCISKATLANGEPVRVLWWNANTGWPQQRDHHRQRMSDYLTDFQGGTVFDVVFVSSTRRGDLAQHLRTASFDVIVLDVTNASVPFDGSDTSALQRHYASGRNAIMLDGSLWIRSMEDNPTTNFPGVNGETGTLLVNQIKSIADAGGGVFIGTDHNDYQVGANFALTALIPGAEFSGYTIPSTDGNFIGKTLLAHLEQVRAFDILNHWQSIPSQGETPVGRFTDFTGQPVVLYSLVETADMPGGGKKRPYVSASFDPGSQRIAIDSAEFPAEEEPKLPRNMPTRKGPPS